VALAARAADMAFGAAAAPLQAPVQKHLVLSTGTSRSRRHRCAVACSCAALPARQQQQQQQPAVWPLPPPRLVPWGPCSSHISQIAGQPGRAAPGGRWARLAAAALVLSVNQPYESDPRTPPGVPPPPSKSSASSKSGDSRPLVRVQLSVHYRVHSRQMLCIGGNQIPFGWSFLSISRIPMTWNQGDVWSCEVRAG
jgi:hypothetical protein